MRFVEVSLGLRLLWYFGSVRQHSIACIMKAGRITPFPLMASSLASMLIMNDILFRADILIRGQFAKILTPHLFLAIYLSLYMTSAYCFE